MPSIGEVLDRPAAKTFAFESTATVVTAGDGGTVHINPKTGSRATGGHLIAGPPSDRGSAY